jgi:hypothetical protein
MRLYAVGPDDVRTSIVNCCTQLGNDSCIESAALGNDIERDGKVSDDFREIAFTLAPVKRQN